MVNFWPGGDCAEVLQNLILIILRHFKLMLQMSLVLTYSASLPVVKVGRIAGQFSKRSSPTETKNGKTLPSYLEIILMEWNLQKKLSPDPKRLFKAYSQSLQL